MSVGEREPEVLDVTPEVVELPRLVQQLRSGALRIPNFARPFVWSDEDRIRLMQSVAQGIPIGSILTWRTSQRIPTLERIGPHPSPEGDGRHTTYVLDGHQRLTALFGALVRPTDSQEEAQWNIYADLEHEYDPGGYPFAVHRHRGAPPGSWMPLHTLFEDLAYLRFLRELRHLPPAREEHIVERATRLVSAFRRCRVPVTPLVTEDFGLAARALTLINFSRIDHTEADLARVMLGDTAFDQQLASVREELLAPIGWDGLHDQSILDSCKAAAGIRPGRNNPELFVRALRTHPSVLRETGERLVHVASFLREHCSVPAPRLLPYELLVVALTEFFRLRARGSAPHLTLLQRWFWSAVYRVMALGLTPTLVADVVEEARTVATAESPVVETIAEIDPPPAVTSTRGARTRALGLLLWRQKPLRSDEAPLDTLSEFGDERGLFTVVTGGERRDDARSQIGNRVLADKRDLAALRRKLLDPTAFLSDAFLASHAIPRAALDALRAGDAAAFVRLRTEHIAEMELVFLRAEGVYTPPPPPRPRIIKIIPEAP